MSKTPMSYELLGRPSHVRPSVFALSKDRLIKLAAILVLTFIGLSALHTVLTPHDVVYGLMIDAGSTGSRIHIYSFQKEDASSKLKLLGEDFLPIKPGLSSYKESPNDAATSLQPLMERAKKIVPAAARATTPVVLRATAGLRMVGEDVAEKILSEVRAYLKKSDFRFDDDSWATILGGSDEGIYSWITVNYLLDRAPGNTVGTLEMGGGSSQVAYVPRDDSIKAASGNCSMPSEELDFKGSHMHLYSVSHLNFGLQKARAIALEKFEAQDLLTKNPCINKGSAVNINVPFDDTGKSLEMTGIGEYKACRSLVDEVLADPAEQKCDCDVCTYHGAAQPRPIPEYVAIAFYLERTIAIGMQTPLTVKDIREKGEEVCKLSVDEVKAKYPAVRNGVATDLCFDLAFITSHLEKGHGLYESTGATLMVLDKINGVELGWCLGAMQQTMTKLGIGK